MVEFTILNFGSIVNIAACVMLAYTDVSTGKGVISCDWFQLSTELISQRDGSPLVAPFGWKCVPMSATAVWGERWFVMDDVGNKVATILCSPRSSKIPCCACNVEIANRWLYYEDFSSVCDRVLEILPMSIKGIRRVDLCCDFEMSKSLWETYCRLNNGTASVKGYSMNNVWRQKLRDRDSEVAEKPMWIPHDLNWGSPQSTFRWKVYYKWLELKQAPPEGKKPYIVDLWKQMRFNEKYVWRIEVSVQDCNRLCNAQSLRVPPLEWYTNRVRLFQDLYADKFVIREEGNHADHRNDKILPFLQIEGSKALWHALPSKSRDDSDAERRIACKLWAELNQLDVQCNRILYRNIAQSLMQLLEKPTNVWAIQRQYGVDIQHISDVVLCKE